MQFKMELERQMNDEKIRLMQADAAIADEDRSVATDMKFAEFALKNVNGVTGDADLKARITDMENTISELKKSLPVKVDVEGASDE